jgi:hypothetical protein
MFNHIEKHKKNIRIQIYRDIGCFLFFMVPKKYMKGGAKGKARSTRGG